MALPGPEALISAMSGLPLRGRAASLVDLAQRVSRASQDIQGLIGGQQRSQPNGFTSSDYLASIAARADPILTYEWVAYVVDPTGATSIPWQYIDTFQAPTLSIEQSPVFRSGKTHYYPGSVTCSTLTLGLYTDASGAAMAFASNWAAAAFSPNLGIYQLPSKTKKTVKLYIHDAKRRVVCSMSFFGCFPTSYSGYGLENTGSNPLVTNLEVSVDGMSIGEHTETEFASAALSTSYEARLKSSVDEFRRAPLSRILRDSR